MSYMTASEAHDLRLQSVPFAVYDECMEEIMGCVETYCKNGRSSMRIVNGGEIFGRTEPIRGFGLAAENCVAKLRELGYKVDYTKHRESQEIWEVHIRW